MKFKRPFCILWSRLKGKSLGIVFRSDKRNVVLVVSVGIPPHSVVFPLYTLMDLVAHP